MTTELMSCPFCGSAASMHTMPHDGNCNDGAQFIMCDNSACMAATALVFPSMDSVDELLAERWNRRAASREGGPSEPADSILMAMHEAYWGTPVSMHWHANSRNLWLKAFNAARAAPKPLTDPLPPGSAQMLMRAGEKVVIVRGDGPPLAVQRIESPSREGACFYACGPTYLAYKVWADGRMERQDLRLALAAAPAQPLQPQGVLTDAARDLLAAIHSTKTNTGYDVDVRVIRSHIEAVARALAASLKEKTQ